jgi:Protein of unknown function (DUF4256)
LPKLALNMPSVKEKHLTEEEIGILVQTLKSRFEKHKNARELRWIDIETKLRALPDKLWSLEQMEATGGEPALFDFDKKTGEYIFMDFSTQSPSGRRNFCYDRKSLDDRKEFKPSNSALDVATEMGIELLTEDEYRQLQSLSKVDTTTSSWVFTPNNIRQLGGALFMDRRYDHVFIYHNGASSYYAARGFRGKLKV